MSLSCPHTPHPTPQKPGSDALFYISLHTLTISSCLTDIACHSVGVLTRKVISSGLSWTILLHQRKNVTLELGQLLRLLGCHIASRQWARPISYPILLPYHVPKEKAPVTTIATEATIRLVIKPLFMLPISTL